MPAQQYSVNQYAIQTLLTWIQTGEIAIPEIQRPFVWEPVKVRELLDSLFRGYPIGYLIAWHNPNVKLKDGSSAAGKRVLIDGQQRVTALMAALLGQEVLNDDYETVRIRIAFNPIEQVFEVSNSAIQKDAKWIPDISEVFRPGFSPFSAVNAYCSKNPGTKPEDIFASYEALTNIVNNHVGLIELNSDLSIEEVTDIFIRVNSQGMELSQADFAMSKIASNETYDGNILRKAIDYFCHLAVSPEFYKKIVERDPAFARSEFFQPMAWLKSENDDIYDPSYTDMLRVAFASEFRRGRLQDLVALLSGRNFETKQYEETIAQESFARLKDGILNFMNETHFKKYVMIVRSAGFVDASLIGSQNALNFGYVLYLALRAQNKPQTDIERAIRRWFVMSVLTGRYSGSLESVLDYDIRQIDRLGYDEYAEDLEKAELSDAFWTSLLPQQMNTAVATSPYFRVYLAAQVKANDKGFLSRDITVQDLIKNKSDVHHIFPRNYLKKMGLQRGRYNQIANYVVTQSEINIAIGDRAPADYFEQVYKQCDGGKRRFGGITDLDELRVNLRMQCIPEGVEKLTVDDYDVFLEERRKLMAAKIRDYYNNL